MAEHHEIAGPARGEPRRAGEVGVSVRIPLDAAPSPRWTRTMRGHLMTGLSGHAAIGHLRLDRIVEGRDVVLHGVEPSEAGLLGPVLRNAIEAANRACERDAPAAPEAPVSPNMEQKKAEEVARAVSAGTAAGG